MILSASVVSAQSADVSVSADGPAELAGTRGADVSFPLIVRNDELIAQDIKLKVTAAPDNFTTTIDPAIVNVASGQTNSSTLIVSVPANATTGTYSFVVTPYNALNSAGSNLTLTVTVPEPPMPPAPAPVEPGFRARLDYARVEAVAGDTIGNRIVLDEAASDTYLVGSILLPDAWTGTTVNGIPFQKMLYRGETWERDFSVNVPRNLADNSTHTITIRVEDQYGGLHTDASFTVFILPPPSEPQPADGSGSDVTNSTGSGSDGASGDGTTADDGGATSPPDGDADAPPAGAVILMHIEQPVLDVAPGEYAVGVITLENPGDAERVVTLTSNLDAAWALAFDGGADVTVPAGGSATVAYSVRAPADVEPGASVATLMRAGEASGDLTLRVVSSTADAAADDVAEVAGGAPAAPADSPAFGILSAYGATSVLTAAGVAVAGAGGAVVAASPRVRRNLWWMAIGAYTRLTRPKLLDHPERERLYRVIEKTPGIHFHALQRYLAWNTGALTYHLRVLERHQLVTSRRDGIMRRFYLVGTAPRELPNVKAPTGEVVSLSGLRGDVLSKVRERGHIHQSTLAEELGASKQTLNYHVKNLERMGLLRIERVGRETVLHMADGDDGDDGTNAGASPYAFSREGGFSQNDAYR